MTLGNKEQLTKMKNLIVEKRKSEFSIKQ
jgi:hypothetical protein